MTTAKLGPNSVDAAALADNSVDTNALQLDSVDTGALQLGSVTNPILASDSVGTAELQTNAVRSVDLKTDQTVSIDFNAFPGGVGDCQSRNISVPGTVDTDQALVTPHSQPGQLMFTASTATGLVLITACNVGNPISDPPAWNWEISTIG